MDRSIGALLASFQGCQYTSAPASSEAPCEVASSYVGIGVWGAMVHDGGGKCRWLAGMKASSGLAWAFSEAMRQSDGGGDADSSAWRSHHDDLGRRAAAIRGLQTVKIEVIPSERYSFKIVSDLSWTDFAGLTCLEGQGRGPKRSQADETDEDRKFS